MKSANKQKIKNKNWKNKRRTAHTRSELIQFKT